MMKKILSICLLLGFNQLFAQQLPALDQSYFNNYSLQPAYAGETKGVETWNSFRKNLLGFSNSPTSLALNVTYRKAEKHGFGLGILADQLGLIKNNYLNLSYAFRAKLNDNTVLSFGINAGAGENHFDFTNVKVEDQTELGTIANNGKITYNTGIGAAIITNKWNVGFGIPSIYSSTAKYAYNNTSFSYRLNPLYVYNASYTHKFSEASKLSISPKVIVRSQAGQKLLNDYVATLKYEELFSITTGYRTNGAVPIVLLADVTKQLKVFYAYEVAVGKLANASKGSFEVGLAYKFKNLHSDEHKLEDARVAFQRDSLRQAVNALNLELGVKEKQLEQLPVQKSRIDSLQRNKLLLDSKIDSLSNLLKQKSILKSDNSSEIINDGNRILGREVKGKKEQSREMIVGQPTEENISGYFLIIQSSVNLPELEKLLVEYKKNEPKVFIVKNHYTKWNHIALERFETKRESQKALNKSRKVYKKSWVIKQ